ncbi:hypothetical protein NXX52_02905 [Bacteroides ovatus]|nr:hypothetical protein [Bacteroides ovatus]
MGDIIIVLLVFWVVGKLLKGVFGGFSKSSFKDDKYSKPRDGINTVKKDWFKRREIVKRKWNGININGASGNRNPGYIG